VGVYRYGFFSDREDANEFEKYTGAAHEKTESVNVINHRFNYRSKFYFPGFLIKSSIRQVNE
jgi:hypothetical protein